LIKIFSAYTEHIFKETLFWQRSLDFSKDAPIIEKYKWGRHGQAVVTSGWESEGRDLNPAAPLSNL